MPAAGSGYARGVNAGVARDELAMRFEDQQRRHGAENAAIAANNATINPGGIDKADQLAVEMEEYTAQQEQRRQRKELDTILANGVTTGDWDSANDALKAGDLPMVQEYFQGEGIVGFGNFDPNNPKHVELRNEFAQDNYETTYDELNQADREEFDKNLVVYDKGAGEIELADRFELAVVGGLPERNTKVARELKNKKAFDRRMAEQKQRVAQENLRVVNPSYSPLPAAESDEFKKYKLGTEALLQVWKTADANGRKALVPILGPVLGAETEEQINSLIDGFGQDTPTEQKELSQAAENQAGAIKLMEEARKATLEADDLKDLRDIGAQVGMTAEEVKIALKSKAIQPVLEDGKLTGKWEKVPEPAGGGIKPTAAQQDIAAARNLFSEIEELAKSEGVDIDDPDTWTPAFRRRYGAATGEEVRLKGLSSTSAQDEEKIRNIFQIRDSAARLGAEYDTTEFGIIDETIVNIGDYLDWVRSDRVKPIKEQRLAAVVIASSLSTRGVPKHFLDEVKNVISADGYKSGNAVVQGILQALRLQKSDIRALLASDYGRSEFQAHRLTVELAKYNKAEEQFKALLGDGKSDEVNVVPNAPVEESDANVEGINNAGN